MVYYDGEVRKEAVDFIEDVFDDVIDAIVDDEDYLFNNSSIDDTFFESVTDRSYSITDAAFVIENSDNVESDSGLWDGKDPSEALECQAAFTYANDVKSDVEEIYQEIKSVYDEKYDEIYRDLEDKNIEAGDKGDEDYDPEDDAREAAKQFIDDYFQNEYNEPVAVVTSAGDRIRMIERYLALGDNAGMWAGFPCGGSYIDSRCGVGFGMPEIHDYVEFDHMISHAIPDISGKNTSEIKVYLKELKKSV